MQIEGQISMNTQTKNSSQGGKDIAHGPRTGYEFRTRVPQDDDVLFGRGGGINKHIGNIHFRQIVQLRKQDYNDAEPKEVKAKITKEILAEINASGGRFLKKEVMGSHRDWTGWWIEANAEKAFAKTSQALREKNGPSPLKCIPLLPPITPTNIQQFPPQMNHTISIEHLRRLPPKAYPSKEVTQYPRSPFRKENHLSKDNTFFHEKVENRPIITSMKGGHRGKQIIPCPVPSTNNFTVLKNDAVCGDTSLIHEGSLAIDSREAIVPQAKYAVPDPTSSSAKDSLLDSPIPAFDKLSSSLIKPFKAGLTRTHSLSLSDINGFESLDEKEKFVNPFENNSRAETPKAKANHQNNHDSVNSSNLKVTFKVNIAQEKCEDLLSNALETGTISLPLLASSNDKIKKTPSLLPSRFTLPSQINPPRRTLVRGNSLAFSDNEEENMDLNESFENPFENENAPNPFNSPIE